MSGQQIIAGPGGALSPESIRLLGQLNAAGPDLISKYGEFEDLVLQQDNTKLAKYQGLVRDEFTARFNELVDLLAQAYAKDEQGQAADYAMVDTLQAQLAKYGQIDTTAYKERWARAVHGQGQLSLDRANKDVYLQLEARYEALLDVHNQFNEIAKTIPTYTVHGGILPDAAVKVLDAYDALATAIEKLAVEFATYKGTLSPDLDSDKRKALIGKFEKLAQDDHLLCFEGVYKVYAQDRELENPAYQNLKQHYEFIRQYWPSQEGKYIATYTRYEDLWAERWKG